VRLSTAGAGDERAAVGVLPPPSVQVIQPQDGSELRLQNPGMLDRWSILQMTSLAPSNCRVTPVVPMITHTMAERSRWVLANCSTRSTGVGLGGSASFNSNSSGCSNNIYAQVMVQHHSGAAIARALPAPLGV